MYRFPANRFLLSAISTRANVIGNHVVRTEEKGEVWWDRIRDWVSGRILRSRAKMHDPYGKQRRRWRSLQKDIRHICAGLTKQVGMAWSMSDLPPFTLITTTAGASIFGQVRNPVYKTRNRLPWSHRLFTDALGLMLLLMGDALFCRTQTPQQSAYPWK